MIIIDIDKQGQNGTTIFNIFDNTTELCMTKYIIGEILAPAEQLCIKNPMDQTVKSGRSAAICQPISNLQPFFGDQIAFDFLAKRYA